MKGQLVAYWTITRKETLRFFKVWKQTLIPAVITSILYFLVFGRFIGSQVKSIQGFSYIEFIVPGLIMMPMITSAFSHSVFTLFMGRFLRTIDDLTISPVFDSLVILGIVSASVIRSVVVGVLVTIVSLFFTSLKIHNVFVLFLFGLFTAITFSLVGIFAGLFSKSFDDTSIIPTFILTPLTYLGGAFYSIQALPLVWRQVSLFNPILYMINGFRFGFLGISDVPVFVGLMILVLFAVVLFIVDVILMRKGIGLKT